MANDSYEWIGAVDNDGSSTETLEWIGAIEPDEVVAAQGHDYLAVIIRRRSQVLVGL